MHRPRKINPRAHHVQRARDNTEIELIITDILTNVKQEFTVAPGARKYVKCIKFFMKLLNDVDNDLHQLPRTVIFTTNNLQSESLCCYLLSKLKLPALAVRSDATDKQLKEIFSKCRTKELPILIFESKIIETNGCDPPDSLKALFTFHEGNFEEYIRDFKTVDSWIDLLEED
uniref:Uncharacterized protein n=1 Tax=Panagrolaimus sp. ES5 TaxID=591445 RepID=A0AC34FKM6_9BILA